ncbi:serine/threonine protein phosphatase 2A 57 kDa regulatory subunit B' beta isoform-like [Senna tora]|uniref:Serine/threonine protein phosphatase 2A 57 kDa regulatory subunit B' beta isoform-like n=1 Tax=Senna tora TaxID=362788 RepID=A0A834XA99_9FABA|nr:serine/threonine protein phosphatase 2A 57 kDa regulatory subunit B' beta isoform-like [Senna tora]
MMMMGIHRSNTITTTTTSSSSSSSYSPKKNSITLQFLFDKDKVSSIPNKNEHLLSLISHQDLNHHHLTTILSTLKSLKTPLPISLLHPLISLISTHLFRPLPPYSIPNSPKEQELQDPILIPTFSLLSPTWPNLQILYQILLQLVTTSDPTTLKHLITHPFLLKLLTLFRSEDPRERETLKNVYHKIYSKLTSQRPFMRKTMSDALLNYITEREYHCGVAELLEIWGTIIDGFGVPLKEEHRLFLMRVLIPMHKTKGVGGYYRELVYCVTQFVQKEPMLGGVVVRGILRYWPVSNCQKEVLLIGELEELVENLEADQYRNLALPLCIRITKCINSWNSQVAERALYVWNNEQFVKMASTAMAEVFPIIVEGMEKNLKWHWSKSVKQLTQNVKVMVEDMDPALYSKGVEDMKAKEAEAQKDDMKRKERWERIEIMAAQNKRLLNNSPHYVCVSH